MKLIQVETASCAPVLYNTSVALQSLPRNVDLIYVLIYVCLDRSL